MWSRGRNSSNPGLEKGGELEQGLVKTGKGEGRQGHFRHFVGKSGGLEGVACIPGKERYGGLDEHKIQAFHFIDEETEARKGKELSLLRVGS